MRRQAKVIIAAKGQHRAAIDLHARRTRRFRHATATPQTLRIQLLQLLLQRS
jgi:hypothetical protein